MTKPIRIQRKRSKGWRMPENTVYVGRPTMFGNPFKTASDFAEMHSAFKKQKHSCFIFAKNENGEGFLCAPRKIIQKELRGKNLACWCSLDQSCHADVLLKIANGKE